MPHFSFRSFLVGFVIVVTGTSTLAQQADDALFGSPYRRLAPGVETVIPAQIDPTETIFRHPMSALLSKPKLDWNPQFTSQSRTLQAMAQNAEFRREVWCLQLSFQPMGMVWVDVPQPSGKMQRKLVWYLVYRVTNTGTRMAPVEATSGVYKSEPTEGKPVKFFPSFVLESRDVDSSGERIHKAYLDRIIPTAVAAIRRREDPNRKLLTSVEIAGKELPVSTEDKPQSLWGVAMWEDVDQSIDFFTVQVEGLSNAYRWDDPAAGLAEGSPPLAGRKFFRKTLQLNFWRPGDEVDPVEDEIRYGTPKQFADLYETPAGVAYRWVYR